MSAQVWQPTDANEMIERLRAISRRYGWRTLIVVPVLGVTRLSLVRCAAFAVWLRLVTRGHKGRGTYFGRGIKVNPGSQLTVGGSGYIGDRCIFEILVASEAHIKVGENTWISHDCHLMSQGSISIGASVLVGEFVSIRDSTHRYDDLQTPIKRQEDVIGHIHIEDDVWIGRGCLIQGRPDGITIGRGAVIAANSVVNRSVPSLEVWGGVPARFIKHRAGKASATEALT